MDAPVRKLGLDPKLLHIELIESVYMEDAEVLVPVLADIRELGFDIELDDFGTCFSSLRIMSRPPMDIVKPEISFIRDLENQPIIVEGIIRMMHSLDYGITAAGVETDRQMELLKK